MNTNKYKALLKVIEYKNLTRAAEELNYTQPAITHMIHSLEKEFGVTLLNRGSDKVEPTGEASRIMPYILNIVINENNMYEELKLIRNIETGRIVIGTFMSISTTILPYLMRDFHFNHPGVQLSLYEGNTQDLRNALFERKIDFAIVAREGFADCDFRPLMKDHLKVILPLGHPLEPKDSISPHELFKYSLVSMEEGSQEDLDRICRITGEVPDITLRAKSEFTSMNLVANGMGVAIIPEFFVLRPYEGITVHELDCEYNSRTIGVAMLSERDLSPASKAFLKSLPHIWNEYIDTLK